jgi:hypothetical protein
MVERAVYLRRIRTGLKRSPVVALLGPRRCGEPREPRAVFDVLPNLGSSALRLGGFEGRELGERLRLSGLAPLMIMFQN